MGGSGLHVLSSYKVSRKRFWLGWFILTALQSGRTVQPQLLWWAGSVGIPNVAGVTALLVSDIVNQLP